MKQFRTNGAVGALLDEYEKAIHELIHLVECLNSEELTKVLDKNTTDEDCRSIQSILTHVIQSGYVYVIEIRKFLGEKIPYIDKEYFDDIHKYISALKVMFAFNNKLFDDYPNLRLEEHDPSKKILVRWGQYYDIEQLFEHAIVHVLRHRRQIERFIKML